MNKHPETFRRIGLPVWPLIGRQHRVEEMLDFGLSPITHRSSLNLSILTNHEYTLLKQTNSNSNLTKYSRWQTHSRCFFSYNALLEIIFVILVSFNQAGNMGKS